MRKLFVAVLDTHQPVTWCGALFHPGELRRMGGRYQLELAHLELKLKNDALKQRFLTGSLPKPSSWLNCNLVAKLQFWLSQHLALGKNSAVNLSLIYS